MRSSGRGRHAPSFVARLRARLRFRPDVPVHNADRVSHPSASASRRTLTSTSTLALAPTSPDPHHSRDQRSSHHSNCAPQPASPITLPPQSLSGVFQFPAFFLKHNLEKAGGLIFLDTGARVNLMSSDMVTRLGLCRQRISPRKLVPFYSGLKEKTELTVEYQVQVDWHFENGESTYTTEFLVLEMASYDILLGCDEIRKYELLTLGKGFGVQRSVPRSHWVEGRNHLKRLIDRVHDRLPKTVYEAMLQHVMPKQCGLLRRRFFIPANRAGFDLTEAEASLVASKLPTHAAIAFCTQLTPWLVHDLHRPRFSTALMGQLSLRLSLLEGLRDSYKVSETASISTSFTQKEAHKELRTQMEEIGCFLPVQGRTLTLHGMIDNALDVNIVTPQGSRKLSAFGPPTHTVQPLGIAGNHGGPPYTARSWIELCVYSQRLGGKSHSEMFYVVDTPPPGHQEHCDVILGRGSFIHKILNLEGSQVAPIGLTPLTPAEERALAAAAAADRRKLEEERQQIAAQQELVRAAGRPQGYDKLAAFLGSHPEFQYFRRFSTLNTKNLLYLQAELANLEQELQDIIQEDKELAAQEEKKRKYPFSVWHLKSSANDPCVDSYQWDKVKEVRELLHQYNAALLQQSQIMDFGAPAKVEAAGLREWLRRPECGGGSIQMLTEKDVWNEANEGDMIAICRQQHEVDNFTKWVYTDFLSWFHNNWGHREKDKYDVEMAARIYDYHAIQSYTYAASILISGVLPASSIIVLYLLKGATAKLMVVFVYNLVFSWVLGFLVKARRAEIFAAAAA
ncbi:hypothetical protein CNMCM8927_002827 [Aspergillus lentulus]|uniref:DUF6594 domain-containing protein n=1 Tax=Aspergillus lentulus TaxID=293939 RepID=A0AAN6BL78_ASPLE|nr:hypothetical protein CNMCM8927_002827 [Aspergillus lentulus]